MQYDDLAGLTLVVRREVLSCKLARRVCVLPDIPADDVDTLVGALVQLLLGGLVRGLHEPAALAAQIAAVQHALAPVAAADARALDANGAPDLAPSPVLPASAPEQPSTPASLSALLTTPSRTASPMGSLGALPPPPATPSLAPPAPVLLTCLRCNSHGVPPSASMSPACALPSRSSSF
jgi:polyadenylate-binding protein